MLSDNHTETVEVEYDPKNISHDEFLDIFWENYEKSLAGSLQP
jgi:peptide methionine sulfoxide reductase MsrA